MSVGATLSPSIGRRLLLPWVCLWWSDRGRPGGGKPRPYEGEAK